MKGIGVVLDRLGRPEEATAAYQRSRDAQRAMMTRRAMVGGAIIVAWIAGLALLVRREYFRPQVERLAEAAMRVAPGVVYYGVMQGERQVGFASSTIDTTRLVDHRHATISSPICRRRQGAARDGANQRDAVARAADDELRALDSRPRARRFSATGRVEGDSVLVLAITSGSEKPDSQRIRAHRSHSPADARAARRRARPSRRRSESTTCCRCSIPPSMTPKDIGLDVRAESAFVVNDSAVFDSATAQWRGVQPRHIRAWQRRRRRRAAAFSGWVDEQGRIVADDTARIRAQRLPYEVAFENWRTRADATRRHRRSRHSRDDGDRGEQANDRHASTHCAFA